MTTDAAPWPDPPLLVALRRALGPEGASALEEAVPEALWRRALVDPAAEFLSRPGKELRRSLVFAGWLLGGGSPAHLPEALARAIEILHAGSLVIDDIEDDSRERRGAPALHRLVGVPLAINTGSWMYFWALAELAALAIPGALDAAVACLVRCHRGQALDLSTRIGELAAHDAPAVVAAITRLKTGALCRLAAELGAMAAGARPELRAAIAEVAEAAGTALQMLDDLGSIAAAARRDKGREDLRAGRATWPWAWLAADQPFAWSRLSAMARAVAGGGGDADALADALADQVAATGRARIRGALDGVLERLTALGSGPILDGIARELRRMEASYG